MKKKVIFYVLLIFFFGCAEGPGGPIIIVPGENGGGGENEPNTCDFPGVSSAYLSCVESNSELTLDIATWNLQNFPKNGNTTITRVAEIIQNMNVDVIAFQEISSIAGFNDLVSILPGWEAEVVDVSGSLELGFIYKTCEITSFTPALQTLGDIWPRPVVKTVVSHSNGLDVVLLDVHLKCCNDTGDFEDRLDASEKIKSYIETYHPNDNVIVLGDFNDHILSGSPFTNFLDDAANYRFSDQAIAEGSSSGWSYPDWPSHLDHILITNELFDNEVGVSVLKIDNCVGYGYYLNNITDHRPVTIKLQKDQ